MDDSKRLNEVLKYLKITAKDLSVELGFSRPNALYNILSNKNGISRNLANKITTRYPIFNYDWLKSGTGEMLSVRKKVVSIMEQHQAVVGEDPSMYGSAALKEIAGSIKDKDQQIEFLQNIIATKDRDVIFLQKLITEKLNIS